MAGACATVLRAVSACAVLGCAAPGCSPALDWREVRPAGTSLVALVPCKVQRHERRLPLAGAEVDVQMLSCKAEGTLWALTTADVGQAGRVPAALAALRESRSRNLDGSETVPAQPAVIAGMTPHVQAVRFTVVGRGREREAVTEQSVVFAQGTRVFHAAAVGGEPSRDALDAFFSGLRFAP